MQRRNEFYKLIEIFRFLIDVILKSTFKGDLQSRKALTRLYLLSQYAQSRIPSVHVPVSESDVYKVSSLHCADFGVDFESRFLLAETGDLLALLALLHRFKPKKIFEFGLARGGSLLHFFLNSGPDVTIQSLDLSAARLHPSVRDLVAGNPRVTLHEANSLQFDTRPFENQMDFIFVDGGHDYETVKSDTSKALKMLRPKGVIVWDDYVPGCEGVFNFVNEFYRTHPNVLHISETKLAFWVNESPTAR